MAAIMRQVKLTFVGPIALTDRKVAVATRELAEHYPQTVTLPLQPSLARRNDRNEVVVIVADQISIESTRDNATLDLAEVRGTMRRIIEAMMLDDRLQVVCQVVSNVTLDERADTAIIGALRSDLRDALAEHFPGIVVGLRGVAEVDGRALDFNIEPLLAQRNVFYVSMKYGTLNKEPQPLDALLEIASTAFRFGVVTLPGLVQEHFGGA